MVILMKEFLSAIVKLAIYVCISGSISHIVGYLIRRDKIDTDSFLYTSHKWENNGEIYRKLKVNKWKSKVPDMSKYLKLLYPKKMEYHPDPTQILRLIQESCVAECIHVMLIVSSPLVYYYLRGPYDILITILYILGNMPYIIIQRYNRPKLKKLYEQLCRRQETNVETEVKYESPDIVM